MKEKEKKKKGKASEEKNNFRERTEIGEGITMDTKSGQLYDADNIPLDGNLCVS